MKLNILEKIFIVLLIIVSIIHPYIGIQWMIEYIIPIVLLWEMLPHDKQWRSTISFWFFKKVNKFILKDQNSIISYPALIKLELGETKSIFVNESANKAIDYIFNTEKEKYDG